MTESAAETSMIILIEKKTIIDLLNALLILWKYMLYSVHLWMYEEVPYWAVLVRMDVRRACSSVRGEGTLVFIQSVPLGGLLTGLG